MKLQRITAAFLFAVLFAIVVPVFGVDDDDETALNVAVIDAERDRPVRNASVTVTFVSGRKMLVKKVRSEWNTKTNSKGVAELPPLPSGKVRLQVIARGYRTFGEFFEVDGPEQTITVKLERPSGKQFSAHDAPEEESEPAKPEKEEKKQ